VLHLARRRGRGAPALAREVALLAARAESPDEGLVADELVRLGEGVERLESLLRLGRSEPA
jgi:hypothetical protein